MKYFFISFRFLTKKTATSGHFGSCFILIPACIFRIRKKHILFCRVFLLQVIPRQILLCIFLWLLLCFWFRSRNSLCPYLRFQARHGTVLYPADNFFNNSFLISPSINYLSDWQSFFSLSAQRTVSAIYHIGLSKIINCDSKNAANFDNNAYFRPSK